MDKNKNLNILLNIKNENINENEKNLLKKLMSFSLDETKDILKKIKKDYKNNCLSQFLDLNETYEYLKLQTLNFYDNFEKEKKMAYQFLNNEEEAKKAGWYDKKPNEDKLLSWAEKAYPKFDKEKWEKELDISFLIGYMKTF